MSKFQSGDKVVHQSDGKSRKMVVVKQCFKKMPPDDRYNELANSGHAQEGDYFCAWISGTKKGEALFNEVELELQS